MILMSLPSLFPLCVWPHKDLTTFAPAIFHDLNHAIYDVNEVSGIFLAKLLQKIRDHLDALVADLVRRDAPRVRDGYDNATLVLRGTRARDEATFLKRTQDVCDARIRDAHALRELPRGEFSSGNDELAKNDGHASELLVDTSA
jgi:hypothetical protein